MMQHLRAGIPRDELLRVCSVAYRRGRPRVLHVDDRRLRVQSRALIAVAASRIHSGYVGGVAAAVARKRLEGRSDKRVVPTRVALFFFVAEGGGDVHASVV